MNRFILFLVFVLVFFVSKPMWIGSVHQFEQSATWDSIHSTIGSVINYSKDYLNNQSSKDTKNIKAPNLKEPQNQLFSIDNIELGESKADVERDLGKPKRVSMSEYGVNWVTYHENYHNFFMIAYDKNNIVSGLFTNQNLISSSVGIKWGSPKTLVETKLGNPLNYIRKGFVNYQINSQGEYDVFRHDNSLITAFYDIHDNNKLTGIQVIANELEQNNQAFYANPSKTLEKGFEYQLFDLTNASRVNDGLPILEWNGPVASTALKHSLDMAEHHYFSHNNLQGKSPFDRMKNDGISFTVAGENIAYGQFSSIFAHEGLMNSMGHRENILNKSFKYLGVGVAFNNESQPFYTEDFYNDSFFK